jgi:hypothetical protein
MSPNCFRGGALLWMKIKGLGLLLDHGGIVMDELNCRSNFKCVRK